MPRLLREEKRLRDGRVLENRIGQHLRASPFVLVVLICAAALSHSAFAAEKSTEKSEKAEKAKPAAKKAAPAPAAAAPAATTSETPAAATADPAKKEEPKSTIVPTPLEPLPEGLVGDPPGVTDPAVTPVAAPVPPKSRWTSIDALLEDLRVADVVLIFFALMIALFALRTSSGTARLRTLARRQAEDNHRAVEASAIAAEAAERSAGAAVHTLAELRETS